MAVAQAAQPTTSTSISPPNAAYLSQALAAVMRQGPPNIPPEIVETVYRNPDPRSVLQMLTTLQAFGVSTEAVSQWLRPDVMGQAVPSAQGVVSNQEASTQNPSVSNDAITRRQALNEAPSELEPLAKKVKVSAPSSPAAKSTSQNQCDVCNRAFSSASGLAKHKLTHSDERKFICSICGRGFKRQDHLNSHALTHREKKPFKCTFEGCPKSYCDNRSLRRHLESYHISETTCPSANQPADDTRSGSDVEASNSGSSQNTSNDSQGSSDVPVSSSSEAIPLSTASSISPLTERACSSTADVPPTNTLQTPSVVSDQMGLANKKTNEIRSSTAGPGTAQAPNTFLSSQSAIPTSMMHAMMSSPPNSSSIPAPTPVLPTTLMSSPLDAMLAANRLPPTHPEVPVAQQQALPLVYPHGTAGDAYQRYIASMSQKKQDEQTAKQMEAGVELDVKGIIQQASDSHGLPTPVAVTSQWMHPPPVCALSTPTPYIPPSFQPPTYTLSGPPPQYPYPLPTDPSLQPSLSLPPQPNEAQLLAALVAAAPPSPSHIFNVNSWPTLGMGPYLVQQMLTSLMHQAAATNPSLHGLTSDMTYPPLIQMQQPVASSVMASENPGVKKENDSSRSMPKIGPKTTQNGTSGGQAQCPICERYFKNVKSLNGHMRLHGGYEGHKAMAMVTSPTSVQSKIKSVEDSSTPFGALLKAVEVTKERELASEASSDAGDSKHRRKQSHAKQKVQEVRFCEEPTLVERSPSEGSNRSLMFDESFNLLSTEDTFVADDSDMVTIQHHVSSGSENGSSMENSPSQRERDTQTLSPTPSPSGGSLDRRKKRPENLVLKIANETSEPNVFNDSDVDSIHPTTPPPYTPPPILSPQVTGLLASPIKSPRMSLMTPVVTPHSAVPSSAKFNIPWIPRRISTDEGGQEQEITLTPKINVGSQFQAEVPPFADEVSKQNAIKAKHKATKVWSPVNTTNSSDSRELDTYFELSRSGLVPFSGSNKEFAHHILFWCKGNVKAAVKILLSGKSPLPVEHPMESYRYSGSSRWMRHDRQLFKRAWKEHGKQFRQIHSALEGNKTMKEVIEYYYFWKKYCNSEYRGRTRRDSEEIDSDDELHSGPPFECEFPGCDAAFPTRQGLNGHIRIHGGNFVYRAETRRARRDEKQRQKATREPNNRGTSQTPSPAHMRVEWNEDEPMQRTAANNDPSRTYIGGEENTFVPPMLPTFAAAMNPFLGLSTHHPFLPLTIPGALTDPQMLGVPAGFSQFAAGLMPSQDMSNASTGKVGKRATGQQPSAPPSEGKPEFKCKVCGRVFAKVKSRSAHMKIHSSRSDNY
jgi:hypothetical protein